MTAAEVRRAQALTELGRNEDARNVAAAYLATAPDDVEAQCVLAQAEIRLKNYQRALRVASAVIGKQPDNEWAHRLAALAATGGERFTLARGHADEAIRLSPNAPYGYFVAAHIDVAAGAVNDRTIELANSAVRLAPTDAAMHAMLGRALLAAGRRAAAETALRNALRLDPNDVVARNDLARVQLKAKRYGSALAGFADAARLDPRQSVPATNLVVALHAIVGRVDLIIMIGFFVVPKIRASDGSVQLAALRWTWLVCAALITVFVVRTWRQAGTQTLRTARIAARLAPWTAAWLTLLTSGFAIVGIAAVTPRRASLVLEGVGAALLAISIGVGWAAKRKIARMGKR